MLPSEPEWHRGGEKNTLTLECVQGLILRMVQSGGSKTLRFGALTLDEAGHQWLTDDIE